MRALVQFTLASLLALWGAPPRPPGPTPQAQTVRLASPSGHLAVVVRAAPDLAYDVTYKGKPLLTDARLSLEDAPMHEHLRVEAGAGGSRS